MMTVQQWLFSIFYALVMFVAVTRANPTTFGVHLERVINCLPVELQDQEIYQEGTHPEAFPLGRCEGDCDKDDHCEGDLLCHHGRDNRTMAPGCYGTIIASNAYDYCYEELPAEVEWPADGVLGEYEIALRLYYGGVVMSCYFAAEEYADDTELLCDVNNMFTNDRCEDSLGDVAFEVENSSPYFALSIKSFSVEDTAIEYYVGTNSTFNFTLNPEAIAMAKLNGSSWTVSDLEVREGAASEDLKTMKMTTGVMQSEFEGMASLDVNLLLKDADKVFYRYSCRHLLPYNLYDQGGTEYYSCDTEAEGTRWYRQRCDAEDESATFKVDLRNRIRIASLNFSFRNTPDTYPMITVTKAPGCGEGFVTSAYHHYTLLVTTCRGSYANNVILSTVIKGSNGNTLFFQIGDESKGPVLEGDGGTASFGIGAEDIGTLISISFVPEDNDENWPTNLCLKEIEWINNVDGTSVILGEEQLGHGVFLVKDSPDLSNITSPIAIDTNGLKGYNLGLCYSDCDDDSDCRGNLICYCDSDKGQHCGSGVLGANEDLPYGCSGSTTNNMDFCGLPTDNDIYVAFQESTVKKGLYLPSTPFLYKVNTLASHHRTMIDLTVHVCQGSDLFSLTDDSTFTVSIAGRNVYGEFESSEPLSLSTGSNFTAGSYRMYAVAIPVQFSELTVLSFAHNSADDVICIDKVEVDGRNAFLSDTFLSSSSSNCEGIMSECPTSMFAVISWPICDIELISQRVETNVVSTTDSTAATMTCSNPNKLFEASCDVAEERAVTTTITETLEISQADWSEASNTQYAETSNTQYAETSEEESDGGSTGTSSEESSTVGVGYSISTTVGASVETSFFGSGASVSVETTQEYSGSFEAGWSSGTSSESSWSSSSTSTSGSESSTSTGSESGTSEGSEVATSNSDETSTENSETVTCSGSAAVPPLHSLAYTVTMSNAVIEYTTYSNLRFTKCSSSFVGDSYNESYLYLYDVPGSVVTSTGKSCSVEFEAAEYTEAAMACDEAAKMKVIEMTDYVPVCNPTTPSKWEPCQCAFGDLEVEATCVCVDEDSGLPLDGDKFAVEVVDTSDNSQYGHYSDWCEERCPNSGYSGISGAASAHLDSARTVPDTECVGGQCLAKEPVGGVDWELVNVVLYAVLATLVCLFVAIFLVIIYISKKICPKEQGSKYKPVASTDPSDVDFA